MASGLHTQLKIEGLDILRQRLRQLPQRIQAKALGDAVAAGAIIIRDEARMRAPMLKTPDPRRKAGTLRRMIRSTRGVRRNSEASAFVLVRLLTARAISRFKRKARHKSGAANPDDPFYWRFVEFGTSKAPAQPFLRPAFERRKEKAALTIADALRAGIAAIVRSMNGGRT